MTKTNASILVCGNGPSFTQIDYRRLPQNYRKMRFNHFFLEEKYYIGKEVDYYVCYSKALDSCYFNLRYVHYKNEYEVDMHNGIYATVMFEPNKHFPTVKMATPLIQKNIAVAEFRSFYEYYWRQYLPTGIQGIALAAALGFKNIFLAGFDLFIDSGDFFDKNFDKATSNSSLERHPTEMSSKFLELLQKEYNEC